MVLDGRPGSPGEPGPWLLAGDQLLVVPLKGDRELWQKAGEGVQASTKTAGRRPSKSQSMLRMERTERFASSSVRDQILQFGQSRQSTPPSSCAFKLGNSGSSDML